MAANSSIKVSSILVLGLLLCGSATQAFNPSTDRVLRLGTNFTLTCIDDGNNGNADPSVRFLVGVHVLGTNPQYDNNLRNRGIIWNIDKNNITAVGNISVPASIENNGTVVRCFAGTVITPQQRIIAVEGPPGPPVAPSVTVTNLTALTLTWTAPWPFPVINYTVTMLNLTSNQITQWTTCDEQLVLRGGGGGQCDELVFTVEAETDVGSTGPSTNTTSGFPKGFDTTARNQTNVTIVCDRNTNILHAAIQVSEVCPYEALAVTLVLTDVLDGGTIVYGPTNQLMFDVSSDNVTSPLSCNSTYNVSLVVENQASQRITINTVYTSMPPATTTTSQTVTTPTNTIITTPTSQVESTVSNWISIGIPVILSIIILIIIIVTITIMAAAFHRHSSKQHKNAPPVELDEKESQDNDYEIKT